MDHAALVVEAQERLEGDDVEAVPLAQVVQDGGQRVLGLRDLRPRHGATNVQDEQNVLLDRLQTARRKVMDKVAVYDLIWQ